MKQSYTVPVRLSEDLLRKLIYISEAEGRTPPGPVHPHAPQHHPVP